MNTAGQFCSTTIDLTTGDAEAVIDVTHRVEAFVAESGVTNGLVNIFVPHATAGIAVIETGAGSDHDLLRSLQDLLPSDDRWTHRHGSPGHGRDHVLPALVAPHATLPIVAAKVPLGTWQSVVFVDTNIDNPHRHMRLTVMSG